MRSALQGKKAAARPFSGRPVFCFLVAFAEVLFVQSSRLALSPFSASSFLKTVTAEPFGDRDRRTRWKLRPPRPLETVTGEHPEDRHRRAL
jgi:hypothetical protein